MTTPGRIAAAGMLLVLSAGGAQVQAPDVGAYDAVLKEYVLDNGAVRYRELKAGLAPLDGFLRQMGNVSPDSHPRIFPSRESRLAYWINAYNALVLWAFAKDYPEKKDRLKGLIGRGVFFYRTKFNVGGRMRTLDDIEDNSLRKPFHDPRIHFAIVCASSSCPWLSRDAYTEQNVHALLDRETRRFLNQPRNVQLDPTAGEVKISKIFDWFKEDFGGKDSAVLSFIAKYRESEGDSLRRRRWRISFRRYNWTLNDATALPAPPR